MCESEENRVETVKAHNRSLLCMLSVSGSHCRLYRKSSDGQIHEVAETLFLG